jgi:hypothetical protein
MSESKLESRRKNRDKERSVEDLKNRTAREVLDDHLNIAQKWAGADIDLETVLREDLRRNVSEDIVILTSRGTFYGYDGVTELAQLLGEELPEHAAFQYTYVSAEGRMAFLEWAYEDSTTRVRDGPDSYLIEDGKIVAQTIHYTVEPK